MVQKELLFGIMEIQIGISMIMDTLKSIVIDKINKDNIGNSFFELLWDCF